MIKAIENLGAGTRRFVFALGAAVLLLLTILKESWYLFKKPFLFTRQVYQLGVLSLPIILLAGLFVGMVLCFQAYINLVNFGAEASVGTIVALALFRELGSVLTGLLYTGRASSSLTAEIGLMRATEQWASYEMMAINPIQYILTPRFWAGVLVVPLLALMFSAVGIIGGYLVATLSLGVDGGAYWSQMKSAVNLSSDIGQGIVLKSFVFGIISNLVALFTGLHGRATAGGIARATTSTVVIASLLILVADFILTAILFG
nr:lipid asymmetry maintenance ABC transporter permease subunit MlaE [Ignatzschineria sp. RMDPL8A]